MQILKLDESNGKTLMYTIQKLGATSDGSNGYKSIYGMIVYKRMTETDLEMMKKSYTYDRILTVLFPTTASLRLRHTMQKTTKTTQTLCFRPSAL